MTLPTQLSAAIAAIESPRLTEHLEWFAGTPRDTGKTGEDEAAKYIVRQLHLAGVEVQLHEFDAFLSYPRESVLEVVGTEPLQLECITHSFTVSTPVGGTIAELIRVTDGDFASARGMVALVDGLCTPVTVLEASRAGVAGLVFANPGDVIHNMIATTIWGTPDVGQIERLPKIPAVSVARPAAEALKARLKTGFVTVRLSTLVETGWYRSRLPEAVIRGSGPEADDFILVGSHYCSWHEGVTDNATGNTSLLELARILQGGRSQLKRSVRICWWPGHSQGRYSGSTWYADNNFQLLAGHCVAYHNVDSPGVRGATTYVARHTTAEIEDFCSTIISAVTGQASVPVNRPTRAADQSFLANGVPSLCTYSFLPAGHEDRRDWAGGCGAAWWWHTSSDTFDKADAEILALDTRVIATAVAGLATVTLLPFDPRRSASEILAHARELAQASGAHLDTEGFLQAARQFSAAAERLMLAPAGTSMQRVNRKLMRLSRLLLPVMYSSGGRFSHDPAELSPSLRNAASSLFPGLNQALTLSQMEGDDRYGFARAGAVRELNRVVDALTEAIRCCDLD